MDTSIGYHEDPENGEGIIRARTSAQLRSWEIPRRLISLEVLNQEFGGVDFPSVYILFDNRNAYVGEAKSVYNRLKTHMTRPERKIQDWKRALIINDGRPATQSFFNDSVIRKSLEWYLIKLLKINRYNVLSQGEPQQHNPTQRSIYNSLEKEINFLLLKKNIITKLMEKQEEEVILNDELKRLLERHGHSIDEWGAKKAIVDGEVTFIREGSKKPKGWQITIRGKKEGSFIKMVENGKGYLLVARGRGFLVPHKELRKIIEDESFKQDTIDIWINFKEDGVTITYKDNVMDITPYQIET
jgi:hypothetical protein